MLFRNPKLVHSISIHFIRVICGGSIRDEKRHIPADFFILPVNGYKIPTVCIGLKIKCISPYQMLRNEGAKFVLARSL